MFIKIHQRKTVYYLLRVNAWFAFIILVAASCIHWDEMIVKYNLTKKDSIAVDVKFLLSLSDKVLPVLENHIDVLDRKGDADLQGEGKYLYRSSLTYRQVFESRKLKFYADQQQLTWLSWNMADEKVKKALNKAPTTLSAY